MEKPRRILLSIKSLDVAGGAERVFVTLAEALASAGHDIAVVTDDAPGGEGFYRLHPRIRWIRTGRGRFGPQRSLVAAVRRIWALRRAVRELRPDDVVAFLISTYVPMSVALLGLRTPLIASEHTTYQRYEERPLERLALYLSQGLIDQFVSVSNEVISAYPAWLKRRAVAIPNPVAYSGHASSHEKADERKIILSVGRMVESKEYQTLIRAFAAISEQCPGWELRLVGDGPHMSQLVNLVDELGVSHCVTFAGVVRDVAGEYARAELFVSASRYESMGLAALEAMLHGVPVVAFSDCMGIASLVRSSRKGVLVDRNDGQRELANAMLGLVNEDARRADLRRIEVVLPEEISTPVIVVQWERIFQELDTK